MSIKRRPVCRGMVALAVLPWAIGLALAAADPPPEADPEDAKEAPAPEAGDQPAPPPQPEPIPTAEMQKLVQDLDSPDVKNRLASTAILMERRDVTLRALEQVLLRNDLSPEQRQRLLGAARQRFYGEPRAALGFSAAVMGVRGGQGVTITNVIPGFPASDVLRAGDRIISADGSPLSDFAAIRPVIVSRDPGDTLRLVLIREGVTQNIVVELGSFRRLPEGGQLDDSVLADAWELRSRRLRGQQQEPVSSGLAADKWESERLDTVDARTIEIARAGGTDGDTISVVMGGEPRADPDRRVNRMIQMLGDPEAHRRDFPADRQWLEIQRLQRVRGQWANQVDAFDRILADPNLPEERRRGLQRQRAELVRTVAEQDAEIRRLVEAMLDRER